MAGEKQIELMTPADRDYSRISRLKGAKSVGDHLAEGNHDYNHQLRDSSGTAEGVPGNFRAPDTGGPHEAIDMHSGLYYLMPVLSVYDGFVKETFVYGGGAYKESAVIIEHDSINFNFMGNKAFYTHEKTNNKFFSSYVHMRFIVPDEGDKVKKGEIIGFLGGINGEPGAGRTDAMHLHFGLGIKNLPNAVRGLNYRVNFKNNKNDDVKYTSGLDNWFINPHLDTNTYIGNATDIFGWSSYQVNYDVSKKNVDTFLYKMLKTTGSTIVIDDKAVDNKGLASKLPDNNDLFLEDSNSYLGKLRANIYSDNKSNKDKITHIVLYLNKPPMTSEDGVNLNHTTKLKSIDPAEIDSDIKKLINSFINNVWGTATSKTCGKACGYIYYLEDYKKLINEYLVQYLTPAIKNIYFLIKDTTIDYVFDKKSLCFFIPDEKMLKYKDDGGNLFKNTLAYLNCAKAFLNMKNDDTNTKNCIIELLNIISGRHSSDNPFPWLYRTLFDMKSRNIRNYMNNKDFNFVLDFFIDIFSKQLNKIQGEDVVPINLMRYGGYYIFGNDTILMCKGNSNYSSSINNFLDKLENVFKDYDIQSDTSTKPKPFIGPPLPLNLNSEIKFPNINPPEKVATATAAKTISSIIMGLFGIGKQGLGTGREKAGGALGMPSSDISQTTGRATGKGNKPTPNDKDRYDKDILADKPKTANANTGPKQNNLLGGKNKPVANSWQDMIKEAFGNLTVGGGKGSISSPKSVTLQQDTNALAKSNTASQPYPALKGMKSAGMFPKPYSQGFQPPTVQNPALSAQKSGRFVGPPAPTSIPSFASAFHKPQLLNTNYIPERAPKGNAVKNKEKQDSQPGKPKLTEIAIRGKNADRYELMTRELPSMWERHEKESAQRLI